ncbi:Carboxylesterase B [Calidithermus terrae]|uniref:Carboxylesterase B n=1 Tax=Calidithermus terrae TaxID=1408545 RepID=A0A399F6D5_9DEIN|nr:Carboxylesterase B [Calidithermus terrae]
MPNRRWLPLLFVILATGALAQDPAFEAVPCPKGVRATRCGYVRVPEDRANPVRTIRLSVYVVENRSPGKAPDPVFFLAGGPGEHAAMSTVLAGLFDDRDFVTFDQRGVGRSQPALDCTGESAGSSPSLPGEKEAEEALRALEACGRRLRAAGIDLSAYNATESAADVEDIRRALGYGKINLVGGSYGTRLALEVMRRFPGALRAVVLDAVIPPQVDRPVETVRAVEEAFLGVMAACRADVWCQAAYPDLEQAHAEVYDRLSRQPLTVPYGRSTVQIDGDGFQSLVFLSLYSSLTIAELPSLVYALREGQTVALARSTVWRLLQNISGVITVGAFFAHECRGEMAYSSLEGLRAAYAEFPRWRGSLGRGPGVSSERGFAVCRAWGLTQPSGEENSPVKSDVPTLLLAGQFDPVTPPRWLELAAEGLSNAYALELPGQAHGAGLGSECGHSVIRAFLTDPSARPDAACAERLRLWFKVP